MYTYMFIDVRNKKVGIFIFNQSPNTYLCERQGESSLSCEPKMEDVWSRDCVCMVGVAGDWIRERFEPPDAMKMTDAERKILLARLIRSTM